MKLRIKTSLKAMLWLFMVSISSDIGHKQIKSYIFVKEWRTFLSLSLSLSLSFKYLFF